MLFYPWDSPGKNIGVGCHSSISLSRGPSQPRNQTHVTYVSCIGKWVLYHQRYLALRVKGLSLGAFLVDHVPLSGPRPWCLFAHLAPCPGSPFDLSGPAHSLSPRTETPLYRVKHPLPGPLSRLPQGEAISLLGLPKFHLPSPSSSMRMY